MVWLLAAIISGVLGGMGMGGGTLYIPVLTQFFGVSQRLAQWLNLVSFVPMAAVSLCIHASQHRLCARGFWLLFVPAFVTTALFAYLATRLGGRVLAVGFGFFLVVVGLIGLVVATVKFVHKVRADTPMQPPD